MEPASITKFHEIPWNPQTPGDLSRWNFMELGNFHGIWSETKFRGIP